MSLDPLDLNAAFKQGKAAATPGAMVCDLDFRSFLASHPIRDDYKWGYHTNLICDRLQRASDDLARGVSSFIIINVPPQHGKSDLCSRRFGPWLLACNPALEIILATYAADIALGMSQNARACFERVAPTYGLSLYDDLNNLGCWKIHGHNGGFSAVGLGGAVTSKRGDVIIIDDYHKGRAEAESLTIRDKVWNGFKSDLMTRRAPATIVLILATRWQEDDVVGRIEHEMAANEKFPRFDIVNIPAQGTYGDRTGYLFPERYSDEWYEEQHALVGDYDWDALYMGCPRPALGRIFQTQNLQIWDTFPEAIHAARKDRGWDLASSEAERIKADPDFTAGVKTSFVDGCCYVWHVKRGQWLGPERNRQIKQTAIGDGPGVKQWIEVVAGYKDAYEQVKEDLLGISIVRDVHPVGEKTARLLESLETLFDGGKIILLKSPWNAEFKSEAAAFPKGKHDDIMDALNTSLCDSKGKSKRFKLE